MGLFKKIARAVVSIGTAGERLSDNPKARVIVTDKPVKEIQFNAAKGKGKLLQSVKGLPFVGTLSSTVKNINTRRASSLKQTKRAGEQEDNKIEQILNTVLNTPSGGGVTVDTPSTEEDNNKYYMYKAKFADWIKTTSGKITTSLFILGTVLTIWFIIKRKNRI
jgi:hypothetical protein